MHPYQDQLDRVRRWLGRMEGSANTNQIEYLDFLWAFFQNCWHVKDWIRNDDTLPHSVCDRVEGEAKKYDSLLICADLANRSKHLTLENIRKDATLRGRIAVQITESVQAGESSSTVSWEYAVVQVDGSVLGSALDIARRSVADWESLLTSLGLSPS